jgi:hypothetical protein
MIQDPMLKVGQISVESYKGVRTVERLRRFQAGCHQGRGISEIGHGSQICQGQPSRETNWLKANVRCNVLWFSPFF